MRVLFTSGGTEEPIDGVRRISNSSTGRTGAVLARYFTGKGADVTLIRSERAVSPNTALSDIDSGFTDSPGIISNPVSELSYLSYANLRAALQEQLGSNDWDAVVHLAAVSDYTVESISVDGAPFPPGGPGKIRSGREVILHLKPTAKLLKNLRKWSRNKSIIIVGFKLTDSIEGTYIEDQVNALFTHGEVDFVVHNELRNISAYHHPAIIWNSKGPLKKTRTKDEMAEGLYTLLAGEKL